MSFQDIRNGGRPATAKSVSQSPSQAIAAGIFQINTAVSAFRRLVDAIGTAKDTPEHRQKLHNTRQRILQLVKDNSAKLKSVTESDHSGNFTQSKKIEEAKLARDFQATLQAFQKVQQLASERESTYMPLGPPASVVTNLAGEEAKQEPESQPFLLEQKRQELVLLDNEISFNEAIIEEREQGIKDIQNQIGQVNDIFKDLAVLVHEQGVVIDDIHSNIESSAAASSQAKQQIAKASKSERAGSTWCWMLLVIFIIAIIIFLLVLILLGSNRRYETCWVSVINSSCVSKLVCFLMHSILSLLFFYFYFFFCFINLYF